MLKTGELLKALENLHSPCVELEMFSGATMDEHGHQAGHSISRPLRCILAFASNVATTTLHDKLKTQSDSWDLVCVLEDKGRIFLNNSDGALLH